MGTNENKKNSIEQYYNMLEETYSKKDSVAKRKRYFYLCIIIISICIAMICIATMILLAYRIEPDASSIVSDAMVNMVGIAVTVWVGLNIYNNLKENEIEEELELLKSNNALQDQRNRFRLFLNKLEMTVNNYAISGFMYDIIDVAMENKKLQTIDVKFIRILTDLENDFYSCCINYEDKHINYCVDHARKVLKYIDLLKCIHEDKIPPEIYFYIDIRESDSLYYECYDDNMEVDVFEKKMKKSIEIYCHALEFIKEYSEKNNFTYNNIEKYNQLLGYMYNTLGYSAHRLYVKTQKFYPIKEKIIDWFNQATLNKPKGRYYQNYGAFYEVMGELQQAKKIYEEALKAEDMDKKIYNLLGSICLKLFDEEHGLNNRFSGNYPFLLCDKVNKLNDENLYVRNAIFFLELSIKRTPDLVDGYYNLAKAYTYRYLIYSDNSDLERACCFVNTVMSVTYKDNRGLLYTKRNIYEAKGEIRAAMYVNDRSLKSGGDVEYARKIYRQRI